MNTAATFASHVGIVTAVHSNGTISMISGNSGPNTNRVHTDAPFNPASRGVSGYASPVS